MTKIKEIRTKVYQWNGKTVPPQNNFCTNASDLLFEKSDAMGSFRFHEWLICEIETDDGVIGIGNAALAPQVAKKIIDTYFEFPPVFKNKLTRWGDLWTDENYPTKEALLDLNTANIEKYKDICNESNSYNWMCYIKLK